MYKSLPIKVGFIFLHFLTKTIDQYIMNVIYYKCNQERLQKTNKGANTMTQNYNDEMDGHDYN